MNGNVKHGRVRPHRDDGLELALTLADDKLASIEAVLLRTFRIFDNDEEPNASFSIEHDPWCPKRIYPHRAKGSACACGLDTTLEQLRDAVLEAKAVRYQLSRCIAEVEK